MSKRIRRRSPRKAGSQLIPLATPAIKTLTVTAAANTYDSQHIFNAEPDPSFDYPERHSSSNRIAANQANARKSTGPSSDEGKAVSCLNALKHGLTGNTVLLASDDADAYQQRLDAHVEQYKPVTFEERRLVQSIHDHAWRLDRILNLESTIYAKGRVECGPFYHEIPEEQRASYIQLEISERYDKQLRNLYRQEARLQSQRARDIKALTALQQQRKAEEQSVAEECKKQPPAQRPAHGFVFATPEIAAPAEPAHPSTQLIVPPNRAV